MSSNLKNPDSGRPNPRLATRRVYSGRVISVDMDTVQFPNGNTGELEMVRHSGASAVVPFVSDVTGDDPQILLLRQYRYAAEEYLYEIPAGRLGEGEAPLACAHRELKEETGCEAGRVTLLTSIYTTPGFTDERIWLYMAEQLTMGESALEPDELIEVETMPLSKALIMIEDGRIKDAKTALAILFAAGFRAKG
jgi:ADP-ribose pyrophosphatase